MQPKEPSSKRHFEKAEGNEAFAGQIERSSAIGECWAVTMLFYSALHYVDSYLATRRVICSGHPERNHQVKGDTNLRPVSEGYLWLHILSENARYKCVELPKNSFDDANAKLQLVKTQILTITTPSTAIGKPSKPVKFMEEAPKPTPGRPNRPE